MSARGLLSGAVLLVAMIAIRRVTLVEMFSIRRFTFGGITFYREGLIMLELASIRIVDLEITTFYHGNSPSCRKNCPVGPSSPIVASCTIGSAP